MSAETVDTMAGCSNCLGPSKFFIKGEHFDRKGRFGFCSNKCLRAMEKVFKIARPKLDPSSVQLYTIKAGCDAYGWSGNYVGNRLFTKAYADKCREMRTIEHRQLSKAITRTSKKPVKAKYTHNEGALPREWR